MRNEDRRGVNRKLRNGLIGGAVGGLAGGVVYLLFHGVWAKFFIDPDSKELQRMTMNSAAEGARFIYRLARKKAGSTIFVPDFMVASTREGVTLGAKEKKNICVVSGGIGTSTVSYKGETFYVCCSGCADAFKENPEKYIAEFKAKNKK